VPEKSGQKISDRPQIGKGNNLIFQIMNLPDRSFAAGSQPDAKFFSGRMKTTNTAYALTSDIRLTPE